MPVARTQRSRRKPGGAPNWIVTFADLATLLLTFFILLLSYSKMDVDKYKSMAASLAGAFGSSMIQDDAVSGSPLTLIESDTTPPVAADTSATLPPDQPELIDDGPQGGGGSVTEIPTGITRLATRLIRELEAEVASGAMNVRYDTEHVVIRFAEDATFHSGSAELKPEMRPIIERVVDVLAECSGDVVVSGYTDNRPIVSSRYRSNWDLSAARAVSVVHELVMNRKVPAERVVAAGRAETNPLMPNTTAENRARNRRVEITVRDPQCTGTAASSGAPVNILP